MPLQNVDLAHCEKLTDLSILATCRDLKNIALPPNVSDIEWIKALPQKPKVAMNGNHHLYFKGFLAKWEEQKAAAAAEEQD